MSIYINEEMNPSWGENESVSTGQKEPVIGKYPETYNNKAIKAAIEAQERGIKRLRGKERFVALCKKLGLHPSTMKDV
jgi:hypothetical protein